MFFIKVLGFEIFIHKRIDPYRFSYTMDSNTTTITLYNMDILISRV